MAPLVRGSALVTAMPTHISAVRIWQTGLVQCCSAARPRLPHAAVLTLFGHMGSSQLFAAGWHPEFSLPPAGLQWSACRCCTT